jgi:DNA polymerase IV
MNRTILHVDMDAFYASVEQRDHPEFRGRPVIVGADPQGGRGRGIVATCSYEARRFGVHSAQPISRAWRLCPQGVYVPPDMRKYALVSRNIMAILRAFSDAVEQVSIDEAFLDVTGSRRLLGSGPEIALGIKDRIRKEQGLTASVGVASNKFVAKVASDLRKPDGLVVVEPGTEREFLAPLPVGRLWGVGAKTEEVFHRLGLRTVGQVADLGQAEMARLLGKAGESAWDLAHGLDDRAVTPEEGCKSIGHETTFEVDTSDLGLLHDTLLNLTARMTARLRGSGMMARTIAIKFRESDFTTYTRRTTLDAPVDTDERAFPVALKLMKSLVRKGVRVRLIGVYGSNLVDGPVGQMSLFQEQGRKDRKIAAALDDINRRYGSGAITRASLVSHKPHDDEE